MQKVEEFEQKIAEFFGAPYAVATDSCTSALELCLRHCEVGKFPQQRYISCPRRTYLSVPMLAKKLDIGIQWRDHDWKDYYYLNENIIDAAVLFKRNSYISGTMMCVSMQFQKHLSVGRLGVILLDQYLSAQELKKMSYDGRTPNIPWREQDVETMGYHYYAQPELAAIALNKLPEAIEREPRKWSYLDYPDVSKFKVFQ